VTDSDIEVSCSKTVILPPLTQGQRAIVVVRNSILTVSGRGRSHGTVNEAIKLFLAPGTGLKVRGGWRSIEVSPGNYRVSFDFSPDGPAIWSVDRAASIKYVNSAAKLMSYVPAD
jgi:hypothetical protein